MKISNYILSASRNIFKHKLFSIINIVGLAVGFATCILIMLFIKDELSYDAWLDNSENIFRVELISHPPGTRTFNLAATMGPFKPFIEQDFPEIQETSRLIYGARSINKNNEYFSENVAFVDNNFFNIFDIPVLAGDLTTALTEPSAVILSHAMAIKYFGTTDIIGKSISLSNARQYKVTAVIKELPNNTHFNLDVIMPISYAEFPKGDREDELSVLDNWFNIGTYIYVKLDQANKSKIEQQFPAFLDRRGPRPSDRIVPSERWNLHLMALEDIHLKGSDMARIKPKGNITTILSFALIALMILTIACFNFMNLSTARASIRAKEVAIRKVLGAQRRDIIVQFLSEAIFMTFLSLLLAMGMIEIILPYYSLLVDKVMAIEVLHSPLMLATLCLLTLIVAIGAGAHPAFIMSCLRPSRILVSSRAQAIGSIRLRTILVVVQFTICISLIVSALVVYSQLNYSLNRDAGFDKENLLVINNINDSNVIGQAEILKNRLLAHPEIIDATLTSSVPADNLVVYVGFSNVAGKKSDPILVRLQSIDDDYLSTYSIGLLEGRNLSMDRGDDISLFYDQDFKDGNVLINQSAATKLGFESPQDALGKQLIDDVTYTIVGVIPDLYLQTTRELSNPTLYYIDQEFYNRLTIKVKSNDTANVLKDINNIWTELFPTVPFNQIFLDEKIAAQYKADQNQGQLFLLFASLAIIISSLGLYGLASFTVDRRIKEIGIRKVMGASVFDVVKLLIWQFSKPVIIANLIAWPLSFYTMSRWLEGFTYRIDNNIIFGFCLAAGFGALLIAWLTVASNSIRVAKSNPINALRYE